MSWRELVLACLGSLLVSTTAAQESASVYLPEERAIAAERGFEGPSETSGIGMSKLLGTIDLGKEFEAMEGHAMRARIVTLLPGGVIAVHVHESRPGMAYLLEGEVIEHRADTDGPLTHRAGDLAVETVGTVHWWKNESSAPAKVLVVDILPLTGE